ncbi:MAG: dienelactone hydrolase family protein, partial [Ralstonia sp.]|nr:dienelactone hydrolase family protein [Ralstonia sp.]
QDAVQEAYARILARQPQARFELDMFGGAYHGFDGTAAVTERNGVPKGRRYGTVTVGGDPAAREAAFAKLAAWLDAPHP